jgi:hypothetical protein
MSIDVIVAITCTVLTSALTVWLYRQSHPKRVVRYRTEVSPLLGDGGGAMNGRLTVSMGGVPISEPHTVSLTVWSSGRADIPSQTFDRGTPIVFNLGVPILETMPGDPTSGPQIELKSPSELALPPTLLRKGFESRIRVLVDGVPTVTVRHALIDIEVREDLVGETNRVIERSRKRIPVSTLSVGLVGTTVSLVLLTIGISVTPENSTDGLEWGAPAIILGMISVPVTAVGGIITVVKRYKGARQKDHRKP